MKKSNPLGYIMILMLSLMSLTIMNSCKKETSTRPEASATSVVKNTEKLQDWYQANRSATSAASRETTKARPIGNLLWEKTRYFQAEGKHITPMEVLNQNASTAQFLLIIENEKGEIISGEFVYLYLPNTSGNFTPETVTELFPKLLDFTDMPGNLQVKMIRYDLHGERLSSVVFDGKEKIEKDMKIGVSSKNTPTINAAGTPNPIAPQACDGPLVCTEWFWQTFINGVLVYEEYLFTTCACESAGGGGGGGDNPSSTTCNMTQAAALAYVNSATVSAGTYEHTYGTAIGPIVPIEGREELNKIRQPKNTKWDFAKVELTLNPFQDPVYSARFKGIRYKYTTPGDPWKWEMFEYDQWALTAGFVPLCTKLTMTPTVSSLITNDERSAIAVVGYTVNIHAECNINFGVDRPINKSETEVFYP